MVAEATATIDLHAEYEDLGRRATCWTNWTAN